MANVNYSVPGAMPLYIQASGGDDPATVGTVYSAQDDRDLIQAIWQVPGVLSSDQLVVSQGQGSPLGGAPFSLYITGGTAVIAGSGGEGSYLVKIPQTAIDLTGSIGTPPATRTHRVTLNVADKTSGLNVAEGYGAFISVLEDTGTGIPGEPAGSITLATIAVTSGATQITTAMIDNNARKVAGINPPAGWTTFSSGFASTFSHGATPFQYKTSGNTVYLRGSIDRSSALVSNNPFTIFTLPAGLRPNAVRYFSIAGGGGTTIYNRAAILSSGAISLTPGDVFASIPAWYFDGVFYDLT